ncbi:MAG: Na+/H+ antiporter NhaA, partial [Actinobacteria bacterium]|nr:Na+/H+ antiporter NhaA [Actinomycetota bacterium]
MPETPDPPPLPEPRRIPPTVRAFLQTETAGAVVLLAGALIALVWANSPWKDAYESLWSTKLSVGLGDASVS